MTRGAEGTGDSCEAGDARAAPESVVGAATGTGAAVGSTEPGRTARVFSMDDAVKLVPQRTERSECYSMLLERMGAGVIACVERMEAKLFSLGLRAGDCTRDGLLVPHSLFECSEGRIWYHFSPRRRKFVLSFFHLTPRGGGLPLPRPQRLGGGTGTWSGVDWSRGIAAWLTHTLRSGSCLPDDDRVDAPDVAAGGQGAPWAAVRAPDLVRDIARIHLVLVTGAAGRLPAWSMLGRNALARQQLESPFARSILAGEALCRLGLEAGGGPGGRALRLGPVAGWAGRRSPGVGVRSHLLVECHAILDGVRDVDFPRELRSGSRHFLTASFMDADLLTDDRRLSLVRSELIYRLAMTVSRSAQHVLPGARRRASASLAWQAAFRRFALLCDFVRLSAGYFGRGSAEPWSVAIPEIDGCRNLGKPILGTIARSLVDFGTSTLLVVDLLAGPPGDGVSEEALDMADLHGRLSRIASELLASQDVA